MDNNKAEKEKYIKLNFLKKVWYCISKFEKYPEMAALGVGKAISYFSCLILLFSIIYTLIITFYINNIKEFDEPNLNFSQKVVKVLIEEDENQEQIVELTDSLLEESKTSTNVTIFISIDFISLWNCYMCYC